MTDFLVFGLVWAPIALIELALSLFEYRRFTRDGR